MIFELSHENIRTALQEYMDKRNIIQGKEFDFYIKTSRKGTKTSRAIIETLEDSIGSLVPHTTTEHSANVATVLVELTNTNTKTLEHATQIIKEDSKAAKAELVKQFFEQPVTENNVVEVQSEEGTKAQPFKKLFQ